jgi:hypothetical protein
MNGFQPPAVVANDPRGTFYWYVSNGMPYQEAANLVAQRFGQPKTKEQLAREQAKAEEKYQFGQIAGSLGGLVVGREALRGFPNVKDWMGYEATPTDVGSGSIGMTRPVPPPTTSVDASGAGTVDLGGGSGVATPKVLEVKGATATIETPAGVEQVPSEALNDPGFFSNIDWNKAAQGGMGAMQLYQAYKAYKGGDKLGAGIYGAAGATNIAASGLAGAAAQQMAGDALGGYLIPGVNIATGLYGGYKTAEALSDMSAGKQRYRTGAMGGAAAGAAIGSVIPGVGTAIGAAVGAIAGSLGARFGSSKKKGQTERDAVRGVLQEKGLLTEDWQGTLADGSTTDFGQDGSKLNTSAMQKMAEANPNAYEPTVQLGDALVAAYGFVGDKNRSLGRMFVRGALSNANDDASIATANMQHFAQQQGITFDLVKSKLDEALADDRIKEPEYGRLMNAANQLFVPQEQVSEIVARPEAGKVARQSAGLYRDASGNLVKAKSMRAALEKAYKGKKKSKEL